MKLKKINICTRIFIFSFILLNVFLVFSIVSKENNIDSYFRIHIVANSNTIKDQTLKMKISKEVNEYISKLCKDNNFTSKKVAKATIKDNLGKILALVNNCISKNGYDYTSSINIGTIYYDKKTNREVEMAAGVYDSIRIVVGEGKGENWWSLIYPYSYEEICHITDPANENELVDYNYIIEQEEDSYSFMILDIFKKLFNN